MKELMANTTLSHYHIVSKIGTGGMGEVYLARDTRLDRNVALKLLPDEFVTHADRVLRFVQEAKAASALNHPNIITIYEIGEAEGAHFIVTEFIEGETLRGHIERARMTIEQALDVSTQIASALSAAHAEGIIHRDIKPENIMLRPDGYVKVLDFGLAKLTEQTSFSPDTSAATVARVDTHPGMVMGTISYMSPEQARGQRVDTRSDIFSLGVVMYEMLAGHPPFQGGSAADVFVSILEKAPVLLSQSSGGVPPELERIVFKCLEKDRDRRYASAQALAADLKTLGLSPSREYAAAKTSHSVAVLPFVNMSAEAENEFFCDGLAEELLNALSKIESLRVAARTSSFSFKAKETDIREIGQKLNVSTVLEGSVRKAGNRLRITAQLVNVTDGYHLWSEKYDRQMEDIFDIQDEISLAIVEALKVTLLGAEKEAVLKRYTDNTEAYQLYLQGRYHYNRWTEEGFQKAIESFDMALAIEPDYALALAGLGLTYGTLVFFGYLSPAEALPTMRSVGARALTVDSNLPEGHYSLAMTRFYYDWDWMAAEEEFQRAIELNPSYAEAHTQTGLLFAVLGRAEEAMAEGDRALKLDPLSLITNLNVGHIFGILERYDLMLEQGRRMIEFEPNFFGGYWLIGDAAWNLGKRDEAILAFQRAVSLGAGPTVASQLGLFYGLAGEQGKAQQILDELEQLGTQRYVSALQLARVYEGLGKPERAFELLEQAYEQHEGALVYLRMIARQDLEFSADPRYADLLRRIGLTK
jgi:serine/threonine protein kinase